MTIIVKLDRYVNDPNVVQATWCERTITPAVVVEEIPEIRDEETNEVLVEGVPGHTIPEETKDVEISCRAYHVLQFAEMREHLGVFAAEAEPLLQLMEKEYVPPPPPPEEIKQARVAAKIEQLWQAADRYTTGYISNVAIGLLTIGVIKQVPVALAITEWSNSIWTEYYVRKSNVKWDVEPNLDFSMFGPMPHSVPELQAAIGM